MEPLILNESRKFVVCCSGSNTVGSINEGNTAAAASMNSPLKLQPNPFRFLLYAEWAMITTCFSFAIMESFEEKHLPIQHVLVLGILSVMAALLSSGKHLY